MTALHPCDLLIINIGELVTADDGHTPPRPKAGAGLLDLHLLDTERPAIAIADGRIVGMGATADLTKTYQPQRVLDAAGRCVTPGLIDPHTHPVFARTREAEFEMRLQGVSYEEIAKQGGGILNSVKALREMPAEALRERTRAVFDRFLLHGTTTIEAKSGYGLDTENEVKSLSVLRELRKGPAAHPLENVPTFLGAHEVPAEYRAMENGREAFVTHIINEMLPAVASQKDADGEPLAEYIDVFCERGVFTAEDTERICTAGKAHGLTPRFHTDEFADIGGTAVAKRVQARTADHLHVITPEGIQNLRDGGVMPVLLPATGFFLGSAHHAPARAMVEAGLPVVIATDFNPGSSYVCSLPFAMSVACLQLGLTPAEALNACTVNAANALDRGDRLGRLRVGYDADIVLWDAPTYRLLPYTVAHNLAHTVVKRGHVVVENGRRTR